MNRLNEDVIDCINSIEDPEDCAILGDEDMENALIDSDTEELPYDDYEDTDDDDIDLNQDFTGDIADLDIEGIDADDIIAAERDIAHDPFEDDELIDIAMNTDDGIDVAADDLDEDDDMSEI